LTKVDCKHIFIFFNAFQFCNNVDVELRWHLQGGRASKI